MTTRSKILKGMKLCPDETVQIVETWSAKNAFYPRFLEAVRTAHSKMLMSGARFHMGWVSRKKQEGRFVARYWYIVKA